ncbi:MAG: CAP domain-containing protein [Pseudomonadota bacterium]
MSTASELERYMLELINEERRSAGLSPLQLELRLNDAAEDHSQWMIDNNEFDHTGIGGSSPRDRMEAANFEFTGSWSWAENIAWQSVRGAAGLLDDVEDLHNSLMNSPGHRANILSSSSEVIGIGIVQGNYNGTNALFVTQKFARTDAELQIDEPDSDPVPAPDVNAPPIVTVDDQIIGANVWRKLSDVVSLSDADGDAITRYELWDSEGGNNWWADGGVVDASSGYWTSDVDNVQFRGDAVAGSQNLWIRGWDGTEAGEWDSFVLETRDGTSQDFDGNGQADILLFNSNTAGVAAYEMSGDSASWDFYRTMPSGWEIAGTGDFDANGQVDILLFNPSRGGVAAFEKSGDSVNWDFYRTMPSGWEIAGTGDFDGNGQDDILLFNPSRAGVAAFEMSGESVTWDYYRTMPSGWEIAGTGDFDGNGQDDILLFNSNTAGVAAFEMSGDSVSWDFYRTIPSGWEIASTGDFDGNGQDDILLFSPSRAGVAGLELSGDSVSWDYYRTMPSGWEIAGTGDFDGNGQDDILLSNSSRAGVAAFEMSGDSVSWDYYASVTSDWEIA